MVLAQKEEVLLLLGNLSGHQVPNVGSCLRVTRLEFLPPNTRSRFQPIYAGIIASFKAQYRKLVIQYQIDCFSANKVFAIDIYQAIVMVERAWHVGVTTSIIQNCWGVLSISIEREIEEARCLVEVDEVATLLHQLTLLSSDSEVGDVMNAHEYLNYEMEFDLNNLCEPTNEEFLDMYSSKHQEIDVDKVTVDVVEEVVGLSVGERSLKTLKKYFEQRSNDALSRIRSIQKLHKEVSSHHLEASRHIIIDSFFRLV